MYLSFYGLTEQPFGVTPNPKFLYHGKNHREVLASLIYAIEADLGFSTLIAEPGMGKTTLLMYLLEQYRNTARTAFIFHTQCNAIELLRYLLQEFNERVDEQHDQVVLYDRLRRILTTEARAGRRVLVVIDEAQNLGSSPLEAVRLLSDFETSERKLIHIIVAGQEQLYKTLTGAGMRQLLQRMPVVNHLRRFTLAETSAYINHRLALAGRKEDLFTSSAIESVHYYTNGVPREINRFCFNALSTGFAIRTPLIDGSIIREVASDLALMNGRDQQETAGDVVNPSADVGHERSDQRTAAQEPWTLDRWFHSDAAAKTDTVHERLRQCDAEVGRANASSGKQNPVPIASVNPDVNRAQMMVDSWRNGMVRDIPAIQPTQAFAGSAMKSGIEIQNTAHPASAVRKPPSSAAARIDSKRNGRAGAHHRRIPAAFVTLLIALLTGLGLFASRVLPINAWLQAEAKSMQTSPNSQTGGTEVALPDDASDSAEKNPNSTQRRAKKPDGAPSRGTSAGSGNPALAKRKTGESGMQMRVAAFSGAAVILTDQHTAPASAEVRQPELVSVVDPVYPAGARSANRPGTVVLNAVVLKTGNVGQVHAVSGDESLVAAATSAVKKWRYRPGTYNGKPADFRLQITIDFRVPERGPDS
jgi:general secretion pathway protein A